MEARAVPAGGGGSVGNGGGEGGRGGRDGGGEVGGATAVGAAMMATRPDEGGGELPTLRDCATRVIASNTTA